MTRSPWPARLAGPRAGVLVLLALGIAGCGTVIQNAAGTASATGSRSGTESSPASAAPASRQLCAQPAAVSKIIIARAGVLRVPVIMGRSGLSGSSSAPPVPSPGVSEPVMVPRPVVVRVVTSPARAQVLARALCALPRAPRGPVNCPAFFLGYYRLTFSVHGRTLAPVTVQVSGCRLVTGLGGPVRRAVQPGFWNLLARTGGWPPEWPVHIPGGPLLPGPTMEPPGSGLPGCTPLTSRTPPRPGERPCPGPYHPVTQPRH
ncbi:MAG TPA: hypothetical protein VGG35_28605 [Streptosporangiaceae bacterium]|jgi:hypothetical protein